MDLLCNVHEGCTAKVDFLCAKGLIKERMLALGLTNGALVKVIRKGPADNLTVYDIRGAMIALRKDDASLIYVK